MMISLTATRLEHFALQRHSAGLHRTAEDCGEIVHIVTSILQPLKSRLINILYIHLRSSIQAPCCAPVSANHRVSNNALPHP